MRRVLIALAVVLAALTSAPPLASAADVTATPSLVSSDHVSEGVLMRMSDGRFVDVFRIDRGLAGDHRGNTGAIGVRKSADEGATWSQTEILDPSPFDDRNVSAFVRGDEIGLVYRQFDEGHRVGMGLWQTSTSGGGWSWLSPQLAYALSLPGRTVVPPAGIAEVPGRGWIAMFYDASDYSEHLATSADGATWDFPGATRVAVPPELRLTESALASPGGDRIVAVLRSELRSARYVAMLSEDAGVTWSSPATITAQTNWQSAPEIVTDPDTRTAYLLAGERIAPDGTEANRACAIVVYRSTFERLAVDPADWEYFGSVARPWPSDMGLYGYPTAVARADGSHLVVFTDRMRDKDGTEGAGLFQFTLEDASGNPRAPGMTASIPTRVGARAAWRASGRVLDATGTPVAGLDCQVQRRSATGTWVTVRTVRTGADGGWSTTCTASVKAAWRVISGASAGGHSCGWGPVVVTPMLTLGRPVISGRLTAGRSTTARGWIRPVRTAGPVRLVVERKTRGGWRVWRRATARVVCRGASGSTISKSVGLPSAGAWRMRFEYPANSAHGNSVSAYTYVSVRPARPR